MRRKTVSSIGFVPAQLSKPVTPRPFARDAIPIRVEVGSIPRLPPMDRGGSGRASGSAVAEGAGASDLRDRRRRGEQRQRTGRRAVGQENPSDREASKGSEGWQSEPPQEPLPSHLSMVTTIERPIRAKLHVCGEGAWIILMKLGLLPWAFFHKSEHSDPPSRSNERHSLVAGRPWLWSLISISPFLTSRGNGDDDAP